MAINTILLDLSVDPLKVLEKYTFQSTIQDVLSKFLPELKETHSTDFKNGGFVTTFTAVRDSFVTVRSFPKGLVAINIEYYRDDGEEPLLSFEVSFTSSFSSKGTFSYLRGILRCVLRWISFHAAVVGAPCNGHCARSRPTRLSTTDSITKSRVIKFGLWCRTQLALLFAIFWHTIVWSAELCPSLTQINSTRDLTNNYCRP